ncbi:unnamed protein product [Microthlaspi erraticum]|uniref:TIR domain-containing protein n=1 Tax=Microthlaspi erraticum TaxID=1685480 RepID=A0A6D2HP02_9BRAS|nr:unnamed protein product [Microthlaspi erraticum]
MAASSSHGEPSRSNPEPSKGPRPVRRPQVFVSFRGVDVRETLVKYLLGAFKYQGVNVFIDANERAGMKLQNLFKRIEQSKLAVVIFSKRYADSDWCMEELAKIDELEKQGKLRVIPVFYYVTPSDVKNIQGEFGEGFGRLKKEFADKEPEKVLRWEASLKPIAEIKGLCAYYNGKIGPPLDRQIVNAVQVWLNEMPGGKVKPRETKTTTGEVVFWAFLAAVLCRLVVSPLFFNDANFFKTRVWLFGFPTAVAIYFCIMNARHKKNPPPSPKPTPSITGPASAPPPPS